LPSFKDALANWRNRLLQQPQFIDWAQKIPFVRPLAQKRARELFRLVAGFVNSQVLLACLELGLLELLASTPRSLEHIAAHCGLDRERSLLLLRAAEALGLVEQQADSGYRLAPLGVSLQSDPGLIALVLHHKPLYRDLEDPVSLLRRKASSTNLNALWPYAGSDLPARLKGQEVAQYTQVMAASQRMISMQILQAVPFDRCRKLLDLGGGDGSFLIQLARRYPQLEFTLFDLPAVTEIARQRLKQSDLEDRVAVHGGDFHHDALPEGQDIISLVRIIHDHDDEPALALLKKARNALARGGRLLIAEPLRSTRGAEEMGAAYFGFYLMAMGSGRPRSFAELTALLNGAGFQRVHRYKSSIPLICTVVTAS